MRKQLFFFSQIPVRRAFIYGGSPKEVFLKVSETQAIKIGAAYEPKRVSPNVLIFPVAVVLG